MKFSFAVIQDFAEIKHILRHVVKIGRAPPGLDESSVNHIAPPVVVTADGARAEAAHSSILCHPLLKLRSNPCVPPVVLHSLLLSVSISRP